MYGKILCPIDGSEVSNRGQQEALNLAQALKASVQFLHILDLGPLTQYPLGEDTLMSVRRIGQEIIDEALTAARREGVTASGSVVEILSGRASTAIISQAELYAPDLIVMGTHGRRGLPRLLLGSDAAAIIGKTRAPVLLVK